MIWRNVPLSLLFSALLLGPVFSSQGLIQANAAVGDVAATAPFLVSQFNEELAGALVDQLVVLKSTLTSGSDREFVAILELRDRNGVTVDLLEQDGTIQAGKPTEIRFSWTAAERGELAARLFVVSSLESPEVLSGVVESNLTVVSTLAELDALRSQAPDDMPIGNGTELTKSTVYTLMVYMVASDLESSGYYATSDILEMMSVGSTEDVNVIVQTGGSANSTIDDTRFIDFTTVQRHQILKGEARLIEDLGHRNMAAASTLADFVSWGLREYPAEKYAIILWDHGAGLIGFGYDDIYGDILELTELRDGLYPVVQQGKQFELVGFDACLMASVEVANALVGRGKYLVASEELEPAWGVDYAAIVASFDSSPQQGGAELGRVISDSYLAHARENGLRLGNYSADIALTMSVIDMEKVPALIKEVSSVGDYFDRLGSDEEITHALAKMIRGTERYGETGKSSTGHLDLYHFAEKIDREFPQGAGIGSKIRELVEQAVVYKVSGDARQDSHGISIFMQVEEYPGNSPYLKYIVGKWISVLTSARLTLERDTVAPYTSLAMRNKVITGMIDGDDIAYVSTYVSQRLVDNVTGAISTKFLSVVDEEAADFIKPDAGGIISYNWSRTIMSMCNGGEKDCKATWITFENNGKTKFAYIPVRMESDRFNGTLWLIYTAGNNNTFEFAGGWPGVDENGNAVRELISLVKGDRVYPFTYLAGDDPATGESFLKKVEDPDPIVVGEGFGPASHKYRGEFRIAIAACDFSGNCGYSQDFIVRVR